VTVASCNIMSSSSSNDEPCYYAQSFPVDDFPAICPSFQALVETYRAVLQALQAAGFSDFEDISTALPALDTPSHKKYCLQKLEVLPASFTALAASRPWLLFWSLRALSLLGHEPTIDFKRKCVNLLMLCQSSSGGFGGGPGQLPHLAPTYAACAALCQM
jgi:protein farnesyltransferase subunit beta